MFSVIFEVLPNKGNWDDYLDNAKMLRPELEQVEGFVDNIRYKSLTREDWILSLSNWRDEKSLVRWRTRDDSGGMAVRRLQRSGACSKTTAQADVRLFRVRDVSVLYLRE